MDRCGFILNEDHSVTAIDTSTTAGLLQWAERWESLDRRVALDQLAPGVEVSTVFLGLDHSWGSGPPLLFETMIFADYGGDDYGGDDTWRYSTWDEAVAGHANAVAIMRGKLVKRMAIERELPDG